MEQFELRLIEKALSKMEPPNGEDMDPIVQTTEWQEGYKTAIHNAICEVRMFGWQNREPGAMPTSRELLDCPTCSPFFRMMLNKEPQA